MASQLPVKASFPAASRKILSEMLWWASPARWECKHRLPKYFNSFSEIEGEEKCEESFSLVASMRRPVGSPRRVMTVTAFLLGSLETTTSENVMPVLMVALLALAAFGGIGILLALAVILEHKNKIAQAPNDSAIAPAGKHVA